jgi:hypothetical protein
LRYICFKEGLSCELKLTGAEAEGRLSFLVWAFFSLNIMLYNNMMETRDVQFIFFSALLHASPIRTMWIAQGLTKPITLCGDGLCGDGLCGDSLTFIAMW